MSRVVFSQVVDTQRLVSEADLMAWFAAAQPGDRLAYCRGHLTTAISPDASDLPEAERQELRRVACRARVLAEGGQAHLLQRRNAANDISYLIEVRPPEALLPPTQRAVAGRSNRIPHSSRSAA